MRGNLLNSDGVQVGFLDRRAILDLRGEKVYELKGNSIYRLSGELVGHLNSGGGTETRLDRFTGRLFPTSRT